MLKEAGFAGVRITPQAEGRAFTRKGTPGLGAENLIFAATIEAVE